MSDLEIPDVDVQIEVKSEGCEGDGFEEEVRVSSEVLRAVLRDEGDGDAGQEHVCAACGKVYKSALTLSCHRALKHPVADAGAQCTLCDKPYPSLVSLEKHTRYKHLNRSRCDTCYRNFHTDRELTEHQQYCRKSAVECPHCSKMYASQVSLRNHVKYKHPAAREHWCASCRRAFVSARTLANHAATLHAPARTLCQECEPARAFPSAAALRSHTLYRHTAGCARCRRCCKLFASAAQLAKHDAKKHADQPSDARFTTAGNHDTENNDNDECRKKSI